MKTITVFVALLAIAAAQVPIYINMPVFPNYTALEWEKVMANQHIPAKDNDFKAVPAGIQSQPESSGLAIPPPEGFITNGNVAYPGQFPWQAAIFIDNSAFCGGSLISLKVVLTAAHCVQGNSRFVAIMGAHFIRRREESQITNVAAQGVAHEKFVMEEDKIVNDIAVLLFNNPFSIYERVNTIALPTKSMVDELFEGRTLSVSGWGQRDYTTSISPVLNYVRIPVLPNEQCARYFGELIRSSNICSDGANGRSTCSGDSGGPLTVNQDGKEFVVGIVSFGTSKGCDIGYPAVYTRVTSYLAWIQNTTGINIAD